MRRGLWLFLMLAAGLSGNPASPPDSPWRTMRAGAIDAGGAAWRLVRSTTATAETGEAAVLRAVAIGTIIPTRAGM